MAHASTRVQYYDTTTDDVVQLPPATLPKNFQWLPTGPKRLIGTWIYHGLRLVSGPYRHFALHATIVNGARLQAYRDRGIFLYANHTQPFGDVVVPMGLVKKRRVWTLADAANLAVPVLGRWIPYGGGIMTPRTAHQMRPFTAAIRHYIAAKQAVLIYPEAHVWPYATMIRPFVAGSFHYPVALHAPSFTITTTYQRRRHGSKPRVTYYVDGPFWPAQGVPRKAAQTQLAAAVRAQMVARSQASTYAYVQYRKRG